jgi:hypothetical protein
MPSTVQWFLGALESKQALKVARSAITIKTWLPQVKLRRRKITMAIDSVALGIYYLQLMEM